MPKPVRCSTTWNDKPETIPYGGKVFTPNLDRLAREGMLFHNAYVTIPVSPRPAIRWSQDAMPDLPTRTSFSASSLRGISHFPHSMTLWDTTISRLRQIVGHDLMPQLTVICDACTNALFREVTARCTKSIDI